MRPTIKGRDRGAVSDSSTSEALNLDVDGIADLVVVYPSSASQSIFGLTIDFGSDVDAVAVSRIGNCRRRWATLRASMNCFFDPGSRSGADLV